MITEFVIAGLGLYGYNKIVKNLKVKNFEDAFLQLSQKENENV